MELCEGCGSPTVSGARFCFGCGRSLEPRSAGSYPQAGRMDPSGLPLPPHSASAEKATESSVSEEPVFVAGGPVWLEGRQFHASVSGTKLVLTRETGLFFTKEDRTFVELSRVKAASLREEGSFLKEYYLELDSTTIRGRKSDLENIARLVRTAGGSKKAHAELSEASGGW
jgi:hypothetical protein